MDGIMVNLANNSHKMEVFCSALYINNITLPG